ncbi:hypothetical protein H6P81_008479 [Aristolochia fimbriata]|uniref:Regulatory protein RecX n=1 Tax=Aristolochia fimbriata TaxID=158543 RepID=A0AAV7EID9_ARIFI|nr:hypothetical protein H6P81_008479 [Aristolochia fimbriata]
MAAFSGNVSIRLSKDTRFSHLIIPWVQKACSVGYCRAYTVSLEPVRYIPKHARKQESRSSEPKNNLIDGGINCSSDSSLLDKTLLRGKRTKGSTWGLCEEDPENHLADIPHSLKRRFYAGSVEQYETSHPPVVFSELENETIEDLDIINLNSMEESEMNDGKSEISNEHEDCQMTMTSSSKTKQHAEKLAIEALAKRAFSVLELQKKLCAKKFPIAIVEVVIAELQERGLLNDYTYAESFSRSRWQSLSWGPRRIKQALLQKGVNGANAEKAIKEVFADSDHDQASVLGMSKNALDRLFDQALKQWNRGKDVAHETRKSRIMRWLQYRGFNWPVISFILKKLEAQS